MAQLLLSPIGILVQQLANSGQPLSGGQIFIYQAGTTTPITTYTDSTGGTPNANPIVLNSAGRLPNVSVWVNSNTPHKMILEDASSVTLSTIDQLYGINDPFLINQVSSTLPIGSGTANAQTIANSTAITSQGNGTEQWYTPGVSNTGDTTINVDTLGAMHVHYLTKVLVGGELQAGVPVILKSDGTFWNLAWSAKGPAADYYVDTGTVNALAVSINAAQTNNTLLAGALIKVQVANTTTSSSPTISINGLPALNIVLMDGTPAPAGCMIAPGGIGNPKYEIIVGAGVNAFLVNPSRVTGSFTGTIATGLTTTPTGTVAYAIGPDGKTAYVSFPTITGTASASIASMTMTGVPAILTTSSSQRVWCATEDATGVPGSLTSLVTNTSTTWNFAQNVNGSGGYTLSGTRGVLACETSFTLS